MKLINIIPLHLFLQSTHATFLPKYDLPNIPKDVHVFFPDDRINWTRCNLGIDEYKKYQKAFECGNLTVPLDYTDKSSKNTTTLNLIKLRATKTPFKGSIIVNPGGPGASALDAVLTQGQDMANITGGFYHIIGFDPRGTGKTMVPHGDEGFPGQMIEELFYTFQNSSYFITQQLLSDALDYTRIITESFVAKDADLRKFRGTTFVARDIAEIAMALGEGNSINYWGTSYGTVLGQVLASMFPDRIERMLLDSNLLADDYVNNLALNSTKDAEKALYHFYDECMAAKNDSCLLANKLPKGPDDFLKVLNHVFMVCTGVGGGLHSTKSLWLTGSILLALYEVKGYLWLDELIVTALEGNRSMCSQEIGDWASPWNPQSDLAHLAIWCSDANVRAETIEEINSLYESGQANNNPFFTPALLQRSACFQWNTHAAEPINLTSLERVETKNPILLVNGEYDPVTPLDHARKISARFPGSRVVVHDGVGHGFGAHPSSCTREIVARYFIDGKLPPAEATCKPDVDAFEIVEIIREERAKDAGNHKIPVFLWVVLGFLGFICVCLFVCLYCSK